MSVAMLLLDGLRERLPTLGRWQGGGDAWGEWAAIVATVRSIGRGRYEVLPGHVVGKTCTRVRELLECWMPTPGGVTTTFGWAHLLAQVSHECVSQPMSHTTPHTMSQNPWEPDLRAGR